MQTEYATESDPVRAADPMLRGITAGTVVLTLDGEVPVEHLVPGDRIITRDTGMATLTDLRRSTATMCPVRIKAGSLGHNRPGDDMVVAPDTLIHVRDWRAQALFGKSAITVPARQLIDGEFVASQRESSVQLFELVFDRPHIVYAAGVEVATGPCGS